MSQMMMAVWATSQRSTRSEIALLPDGSLLRLRARRAMVPGTLGRFASGASWPESGVWAAASARAPGNIPRKDLLRMSLLAFHLYHSINDRGVAIERLGIITCATAHLHFRVLPSRDG